MLEQLAANGGLEQLRRAANEAQEASRITGDDSPTLEGKVEGRSQFALRGFVSATTLRPSEGLAGAGFAAQQTPPIESGITDCVKKVRRIIIEDYKQVSQPDYAAVSPPLPLVVTG